METATTQMNRREKLYFVFLCVILLGIAAHGYCYFNLLYSHDSLHIVRNSAEMSTQLALGRFGIPLYFHLRGGIASSSLLGVLALLYLAGTSYLVVTLLQINSKTAIALTCGILVTNEAFTFLNASYVGVCDVYMLSLLLCVSAVYLTERCRYGFLFAPVCLCLSLGMYQSYFQAAVFLAMLLVIQKALHKQSVKAIFLTGLKHLGVLLAGLLLYSLVLKLLLQSTTTELMNTYNGLSEVGHFGTPDKILQLMADTFLYPFQYYLAPPLCNSAAIAACNCALFVILLLTLGALLYQQKLSWAALALLLPVCFLLPFGMNVVYFISHGLAHALMVFSFFLAYIFVLSLLEQKQQTQALWNTKSRKFWQVIRLAAFLCLTIIIANNISFSNQLYLKKNLEFQNTLSTMTRIIDRIEQTDGYEVNETPVVFVGTLMDSPLSMARVGFEEITGTGATQNFSTTYYRSYQWYLETVLAYPVNLLPVENVAAYNQNSKVQQMPAFPHKKSCQIIDGVLVVKLSDASALAGL